eukprot:TRINITY_DN4230_c0_g1_i2.p1 TRINITY_DN4230_c0_g1~~TRINITY_DN4230_c0_g1_i2.p1  ORF type:complete len:301 (+),score=23.01 TRINITY_DN4230_c0_g1_i2:44-946(+)
MQSAINDAFGNVNSHAVKIPPSAGRPVNLPTKVPMPPPGVKVPISPLKSAKTVAFSMTPEVIQHSGGESGIQNQALNIPPSMRPDTRPPSNPATSPSGRIHQPEAHNNSYKNQQIPQSMRPDNYSPRPSNSGFVSSPSGRVHSTIHVNPSVADPRPSYPSSPSARLETINVGYKSPASIRHSTHPPLQSHHETVYVGHKGPTHNGPIHGRVAQYPAPTGPKYVHSGHLNTFGEWIDTTSPESIAYAGPYRPSGRTHEWTDSGRLDDISPSSKGHPKWCEREHELYARLEDVCRDVEFGSR